MNARWARRRVWKHVIGGAKRRPGRIRGRVRASCWRHGWASARVRDAIWGSAVSTWPRRREREATKKRLAHAGSPGKGLIMQVEIECRLGLVGCRGQSKKTANGWLALIQTETRARHKQQQTGPGSHGSSGGLPVSDPSAGCVPRYRGYVLQKQPLWSDWLAAVPHCPPCVCAACSGHMNVDVAAAWSQRRTVFLSNFSCWHHSHARFRTAPHFPLHVTVPSQWLPHPTCGDGVKTDELE